MKNEKMENISKVAPPLPKLSESDLHILTAMNREVELAQAMLNKAQATMGLQIVELFHKHKLNATTHAIDLTDGQFRVNPKQ